MGWLSGRIERNKNFVRGTQSREYSLGDFHLHFLDGFGLHLGVVHNLGLGLRFQFQHLYLLGLADFPVFYSGRLVGLQLFHGGLHPVRGREVTSFCAFHSLSVVHFF